MFHGFGAQRKAIGVKIITQTASLFKAQRRCGHIQVDIWQTFSLNKKNAIQELAKLYIIKVINLDVPEIRGFQFLNYLLGCQFATIWPNGRTHNSFFQKKTFFGSDDDPSPPCFLHCYIIYRIYPPFFSDRGLSDPVMNFGFP